MDTRDDSRSVKPPSSAKNPEQEAEKPGGIPTDTVKGSANSQSNDLAGQQGSTRHKPD